MARLSVRSDDVRDLVDGVLVPLFVTTRSVAGMARRLNDALRAEGETRVIHPNRIQAMLSDDASRGVNELTFALLARAAGILRSAGFDPAPAELEAFGRDVEARAAVLAERGLQDPEALQRELGLPSAVLRAATGKLAPSREGPPVVPHPPGAGPDWSFQDVAVARALDAIRRRPHGNVGLVLPTGAGKTRTALRVVLATLAHSPDGEVVWLTHRRSLRRQAHAALLALVRDGAAGLPSDARRLTARITFAMISEAASLLDADRAPLLVVIDEAHHAAAASYAPIFASRLVYPVLLLTATPNRTDGLPIGMDEVAFTITFRELAERRVILIPKFEPIALEGLALTASAMRDLADRLVDELADRFTKTLVLASTVEQVIAFHGALLDRLSEESDHPLSPDDVGYVHGGGNSHGLDEADFLTRFSDKPRAVLVSAQMLLEGFDDPSIDSVVMTYATSSVSKLMQAVGRCVRHSPGKDACYVLQVDDPSLAYRFDQRWLYQEIDDRLRPDLSDEDYGSRGELLALVAAHLESHKVHAAARAAAMGVLAGLPPDEDVRLLFYGLPYYGLPEEFATKAPWGVFVETRDNSTAFRAAFNGFSRLGARFSDPSDYLESIATSLGLVRDVRPGTLWRSLVEVLTAAYFAAEELRGAPGATQDSRPRRREGTTTWLRYVVLHHVPRLPGPLASFLADCHNAAAVEEGYLADPGRVRLALKTQLPLGGFEAVLLDAEGTADLDRWIERLRSELLVVAPERQFERLAGLAVSMTPPRLPAAHLSRLERLISDDGRRAGTLALDAPNTSGDGR